MALLLLVLSIVVVVVIIVGKRNLSLKFGPNRVNNKLGPFKAKVLQFNIDHNEQC